MRARPRWLVRSDNESWTSRGDLERSDSRAKAFAVKIVELASCNSLAIEQHDQRSDLATWAGNATQELHLYPLDPNLPRGPRRVIIAAIPTTGTSNTQASPARRRRVNPWNERCDRSSVSACSAPPAPWWHRHAYNEDAHSKSRQHK